MTFFLEPLRFVLYYLCSVLVSFGDWSGHGFGSFGTASFTCSSWSWFGDWRADPLRGLRRALHGLWSAFYLYPVFVPFGDWSAWVLGGPLPLRALRGHGPGLRLLLLGVVCDELFMDVAFPAGPCWFYFFDRTGVAACCHWSTTTTCTPSLSPLATGRHGSFGGRFSSVLFVVMALGCACCSSTRSTTSSSWTWLLLQGRDGSTWTTWVAFLPLSEAAPATCSSCWVWAWPRALWSRFFYTCSS